MYKIALIDDHEIVLDALEIKLNNVDEFTVVFKSKSGDDFLNFLKSENVDLLILDLNMPNEDGIQVAKRILKLYPNQKIIILSTFNSEVIKRLAMSIGILQILPKTISFENLINEINKSISNDSINLPIDTSKILTKRQHEILKHLANGKTAKEIGNELFISEHTVRAHKVDMMEKFGITNPAELIKYAVQIGLIS